MSIIRHTEVTLDTIVSESNLIVEVQYVEVFEEEVAIPDHPSVKPFIKKGLVFQVNNILKDNEGNVLGALIRVPQENWKRSFSQYVEHHAGGVSKSFGVKSYKTNVPSMKDAEILFLHVFRETYHLVADQAFESVAKKKQIEDLIRMS